MKKIKLILSVLLITYFLSWCSIDWNDNEELLYKKKIDCTKSVETLKKINTQAEYTNYYDINYNKKLDACIVWYNISENMWGEIYHSEYKIIDSLTLKQYLNLICNKSKIVRWNCEKEDILNKNIYEEKIKELKWE